MKLTRKFLATLGIEDDKADEIIAVHVDTVNNLKDELESYKESAEKLPAVQKELDELKEQTADDGKNPYEVKYKAVKEEFDAYKAEQEKKAEIETKTAAYRALLKKSGIAEKRIDAVLRVSPIDSLKLTDDGAIDGEKELMESVKKEWADFIVSEEVQGAKTPTPPSSAPAAMTKEEIMKIKDAGQRQKAIAENIDLFKKG